jgi:hypothetical protein
MKKRCRVYKPKMAQEGLSMTQDTSRQSIPQQKLQRFLGSVNQAAQNYEQDEAMADQVEIMKSIGQETPQFKQGGSKNWIQKANRSMKRKGTVGKFTEYCGGKVTADCIERGLNSPDPDVRKRATFAKSMRSIAKDQWGGVVGDQPMDQGYLPMYANAGEVLEPGSNIYGKDSLMNPYSNVEAFAYNAFDKSNKQRKNLKKGFGQLMSTAYQLGINPTRYVLGEDQELFDDPNMQLDKLEITGYKPGQGGKTSTLSVRATGSKQPIEKEVVQDPGNTTNVMDDLSIKNDDWSNSYYNPQPGGANTPYMGISPQPETQMSYDEYLKTLNPASMNIFDRRKIQNYMRNYGYGGYVPKAQDGIITSQDQTVPITIDNNEMNIGGLGIDAEEVNPYIGKSYHVDARFDRPEDAPQYYTTFGDKWRNLWGRKPGMKGIRFEGGGYIPMAQAGESYPGLYNPWTTQTNPLTGETPAVVYNPTTGSYEMNENETLDFERTEPESNQVVSEKDLELTKQSAWKTATQNNPYLAANTALGAMDLLRGLGYARQAGRAGKQLGQALDPMNMYKTQAATRGDYTFNYPLGPHLMPDKYTRWGDDTKVARDGYSVGQEAELTPMEIEELIRQGYELEYI